MNKTSMKQQYVMAYSVIRRIKSGYYPHSTGMSRVGWIAWKNAVQSLADSKVRDAYERSSSYYIIMKYKIKYKLQDE